MLAVYLFLALWVVLALGLFVIAARGGVAGARAMLHGQSHRTRRAMGTSFVVVFLVFGIGLPILFLTGNHAKASNQIGGIRLTAAEKRGREIFGEQCAVCHTLAAANAVGKVGPNLDTLKPPASLVLNTINNGCLQNPPANSPQTCLGEGTMPANVVQGRDAQNVADFVAKVAGRE